MRCVPPLRAIAEIHLVHDLLQVRVEALHVRARRERHRRFGQRPRARRTARGAEQLVAHELHGHREVQRRVLRVGRDADQQVRERQFFVGETGALGAKQHGGRAALRSSRRCARAASCRSSARKFWSRVTRGGGGHEAAVGHGLGDAVHHAGARQQIVGARGARAWLPACGNALGRTSTSSASAMFFMARATAPMFPGCEGSTSTMRMAVSGMACIIAALSRPPPHRCSPYSISRCAAARRAGDIIVRAIPRLEAVEVDTQGPQRLRHRGRQALPKPTSSQTIRRLYPDHAFLAEESGASGDSDVVWIIDPLDGTTNFMHGFPTFAVSIACQIGGRLEHAVVFDPMRQEIFTASRGDGAQLRRPQDARQQADHARRLADRHRLPVSRRRALSR